MRFTPDLTYHAGMLLDTERTGQFRRAVHAAVRPGDVVVDVGCGTGVLAFFACQAGARHVYAIDEGPIIGLARDLAAANGFADRVTFLHSGSWAAEVPEPADVVVSETLWNFGLGEGMVASLADASARWLRPGGIVIPASFEMLLAPAALDDPRRPGDDFGAPYGLDLSRLSTAFANSVGFVQDASDRLLGGMTSVGTIALPYGGPLEIELGGTLAIDRPGRLDALAGSFRARLHDAIGVSNAPPNAAPSWGQAMFPLARPVAVEPGDTVDVRVRTYADDDMSWRWSARVARDGRILAETEQSTRDGLLAPGVTA